jgi:zinc protease
MHILRHLTVLLLAILAMPAMKAQETIQNDPETTIGRLENGLTYYLRHNTENKGCADFYIIHNVGALQEEDNQNGLAHFLEHMAFNGTERYPDKTILNFLEKDGVRFGYNVNAYTSRTETVYNISAVPQVRESFVDSVLFVLHDWSCAISCEQDALDAERGVISEEWRRKDEPRALVADLQNKIIYKGAKHAERNVLGTLEIINGFERQEILDFYHKWYRPDLQAIAIVGDIDVDDMEERVKKIFSGIPAQENPAQKEEYAIPALEEPMFTDMLHPLIKFNALKVIHKQPYPPVEERNKETYFKDMALRQVATEIMKERFSRETLKEDCPAKNMSVVTSKVSDDFYTTLFTISPKTDDKQEAILELYAREVKRILTHGFSADELQAAKFQAAKRVRSNLEEPVKNGDWIKSCLEHFLRGEVLISPAEKKDIQKRMIAEADAEEVLSYLHKMLAESEKIYSYSTEKDKTHLIPSVERMKEILAKVDAMPVEASYPEFRKIDISVNPDAGRIVATEGNEKDGEVWTLSNGARIRRMQTEPVKSSNHMVIKATFNTGFKVFPEKHMECSRIAASYIDRNFGFRKYSRKDLRDSPETGDVSMTVEIGKEESAISVTCSKNDVEKAFRMLYLTLTEPYFDSPKALERFKKTQLKSYEKERSEKSIYDEEVRNMRYCNHPWRKEIEKMHYEHLDMNFIREIFRLNFSDFSNMKVYICDDLDTDLVRNCCEKYIASLDGNSQIVKSEQLATWPLYKGKGRHIRNHPKKEVPKSEVKLSFKHEVKMEKEDFVTYDILDYIMNARCMNKIREERGGTYSVTFRTEFFPEGKIAESSIEFQTRPEMTDILVADAEQLMAEMAADGPEKEEFDNACRYLAKRYNEQTARNRNNLTKKMDAFMMKDKFGIDRQTDYLKILDRTSRKDVKKMAKKIVKGDSLVSVYTEK